MKLLAIHMFYIVSTCLLNCSSLGYCDGRFPTFRYQYTLPESVMDRALYNYRATDRLQNVLHKLQRGENVCIVILGGSFSDHTTPTKWFSVVKDGLMDWFPGSNITIVNSAIGGTSPALAVVCYDRFVSCDGQPVDLVFVEYNINNGFGVFPVNDERIKAEELLMRRILAHDGHPAALFVQFNFPEHWLYGNDDKYYLGTEDQVSTLLQYYGIPWISMRNAIFHLQMNNRTGYTETEIRYDRLHYNHVGHRYAADVVMRIFESVTWVPIQKSAIDLPQPMFPGNIPGRTVYCVMKNELPNYAKVASGFKYGSDVVQHPHKVGYYATEPGSNISFALNTTSVRNQTVVLYVGLLHSYQHMGIAVADCVQGCSCPSQRWDTHHIVKESVTLMRFLLLKAYNDECHVRVTVDKQTSSGEHKVKVEAFMLVDTSQPIIVSFRNGILPRNQQISK